MSGYNVGMTIQIALPQTELEAVCHKYGIQRLMLFGSVLRDDFTPDSDVDVLVEFEPGSKATYLDLAGIQHRLSDLLGRPVDIGTPASLSPYIKDTVLSTMQVIYDAQR
jgi:predicted nucleotidyltransferase